jgi:Glutamine phosphoribosylpyrophosphate amidotransferase
VIAVPDSGTASALGYATALGIPFGEGLIKTVMSVVPLFNRLRQ